MELVLAGMAVQVDEAGEEKILWAGGDDGRIADRDPLWRERALPDGDDASVPNEDAAVWDHGVLVVHGDDCGALDQDCARGVPRCRLARLSPGGSRRQAAE
jgi:hypothetical protein